MSYRPETKWTKKISPDPLVVTIATTHHRASKGIFVSPRQIHPPNLKSIGQGILELSSGNETAEEIIIIIISIPLKGMLYGFV